MAESTDKLHQALSDEVWKDHEIGDEYLMDGKPERWKIAYYPIFEDGSNGNPYVEPRALVERPSVFKGVEGTDFREVPLRYLTKIMKETKTIQRDDQLMKDQNKYREMRHMRYRAFMWNKKWWRRVIINYNLEYYDNYNS